MGYTSGFWLERDGNYAILTGRTRLRPCTLLEVLCGGRTYLGEVVQVAEVGAEFRIGFRIEHTFALKEQGPESIGNLAHTLGHAQFQQAPTVTSSVG